MAQKKRPIIKEDELAGVGIVRQIAPLLDQLRQREQADHGNTQVHLGDALVVLLACFFNPTVRSLRLIDQLSAFNWVKAHTELDRIPRSTLSDALRRFDPEELRPIMEALVRQIPALARIDSDLEKVTRKIIAADGSYFNLVGEVAWALAGVKRNGQSQSRVRLNLQLDVRNFSPVDLDISGRDDGSEAAAFIRRLQSGAVYLVDRNFVHFGFINAVLNKNSSLVLRLKKDICFTVAPLQTPLQTPSRQLSDEDRQNGVLRDEVGHLSGPQSATNQGRPSRTSEPPSQLLRRVTLWDEKNKQEIVLITDLLDLPARVIALLYRLRWEIELFFRWLKVWAAWNRCISLDQRGITLQFYVAVIACLLMHLRTGRKVNKYAIFALSQVAAGLASYAEIEPMLERIEREKELERARLARKKAALQAAREAAKNPI